MSYPDTNDLQHDALVREIATFVEAYDHGNDPYCCSNSLYWCADDLLKKFLRFPPTKELQHGMD